MRITNAMLLNMSLHDLDGLREKYAKAQASVHGRVLDRPSEDPQRVVEAMDLSGAKLRLQRAQRSGQDSREWLSIAETGLTVMIERLQDVRDLAVQAGSPALGEASSRESLARNVLAVRDSLMRELNSTHRDRHMFAGWKSDAKPFQDSGTGGVTYMGGLSQAITREIASGLSVTINVSGDQLLAGGDFMKTLTDIAADLRAGRTTAVTTDRLQELDSALSNVTILRSDLGIRQDQVAQYETFAEESLLQIEDRLTDITGADLETAVLRMTEAQTAYQTALASFAKALPTSLIDYMR